MMQPLGLGKCVVNRRRECGVQERTGVLFPATQCAVELVRGSLLTAPIIGALEGKDCRSLLWRLRLPPQFRCDATLFV